MLEEVRVGEKRCREMTERIQEQQSTIAQQETQLTVTVREKENLETSLAALREEVVHNSVEWVHLLFLSLSAAVCHGVQSS